MMKRDELLTLLPWTQHFPTVLGYAESFSKAEWLAMNDAGLHDFFTSFSDTMIIHSMFNAIKASPQNFKANGVTVVMSNPSTDSELSFRDMVFHILEGSKAELKKHSVGNPAEVMQWLGADLLQILDSKLPIYAAKDNLIQWLSDPNTRAILEGNVGAIQRAQNGHPQISRFSGKDTRDLLKANIITPEYFLALVKALAESEIRSLPSWVGPLSSNQQIAAEFTDEELALIGSYLNQQEMRYDDIQLDAFLRLVSSKLSQSLSIGTPRVSLSAVEFKALLKDAHLVCETSIDAMHQPEIVVDHSEPVNSSTADMTPIRRVRSQVEKTSEQLLSGADRTEHKQTRPMPRIPTQAFVLFALLMAARMYVAACSTENSGFVMRCLQSMLQLRGPSNKTADIAQSALLGLAGIFIGVKRGLLQPTQADSVNNVNFRS